MFVLSESVPDPQHAGYVQLAPVSYAKDTKALLGFMADHDDTYERGGPGTKVGHAFEDTARLWESTFGLSYERAGSMDRNSRPVNVPPPPVSDLKTSCFLDKPPSILPWDFRIADHNPTKYPVLTPRHILQVHFSSIVQFSWSRFFLQFLFHCSLVPTDIK